MTPRWPAAGLSCLEEEALRTEFALWKLPPFVTTCDVIILSSCLLDAAARIHFHHPSLQD